MERTEIFDGVKGILQGALGVPPELITPQTTAAALGADSLDVMDVVVRINRRFSLTLSSKELDARLQQGSLPGAPKAVTENGPAVASPHKIADLLTVGLLVDLVESEMHTAEKAPARAANA
jgi:acyl carrier protein